MASKKEVFDLFPNLSRYAAPVKPADPPAHLTSGEFSDTVLHVLPALPKTEVSLRVQFRCSVHLVEGDTVLLTLAGFKGEPQSFGVEARPHPDGFDAAQHFRGFWSGDKKIKGGKKVKGIPPKQTIVLQVIQRIEEGTLVVLGVPFTVGLVSPDKQPANSIKLKIEGNVRHALDGKVEETTLSHFLRNKKRNHP
ncbi:hypothetical protein ADEAN_000853800 [Angomonas deanei]|uniref:Uncharacterized protein n=1 Tax=Angomonas deanei TaxID=59799 RepID=A0A7G2CR86_9TRYP|nr:hypothetical protein ADEAN_000853800 [Angomonas deanei]